MRDTRALRCALAAAVVLAAAAGTAGCGVAEAGGARYGVTERPPQPSLRASVPAGATGVGVTEPLVLSAVGGTLTTVTVTSGTGRPVPGTLSEDHTRWVSGPLAFDTEYALAVTGMGTEGRPIEPLRTGFRTVKPARTLSVAAFRPSKGQVVGVAMPISIYFNHPVKDRAAVERRLGVTASVPTEGSFHWVGDDQVNWRPKDFWAPGTTVTVRSGLRGVDAGGGTVGAADTASVFTVGHRREAVGDAKAHTLTLYEDGRQKQVMPASFGRPRYPTQNGVHVAFEKHLSKRMRSDSWGGPKPGQPGFYDEVLPLAVRISANGEFVHVNGLTVRQQGRSNVSHGCVNLSPANGRAFFAWVQIGDPVRIVGSSRELTPADGDISDWLVPWDRYTAGSALTLPMLGDMRTPVPPLHRVTE